MRKILLLLLLILTPYLGFSQAILDEGIQLGGNNKTTTANKVLMQEDDGLLNYKDKEVFTENSAGAISGFALTNNGNGTVNIASGFALLRTTPSETGVLQKYQIAAVTNLALADNANSFIIVSYNAGSPIITTTTDTSTINTTTNTLLYVVARVGTKIDHAYAGEQNVDSNGKLRRRFLNTEAFSRAQGALLSFANRNLTVTAGLFYSGLTPYTTSAFNTAATDTFTNVYNNGGVWTRQTGQTQVNNTQYNVGGVLTTMTNSRYRVDYVYFLVNNPTQIYTVMGSEQYTTLALARLAPLPTVLPVELQRLGVLLGRVIIEKDATTVSEVASSFTTVFAASSVLNHNDTANIQGGAVGDYQHVTTTEKATWNGKQNALTNPVTGVGVIGRIAFWNTTSNITNDNGLFWDNSSKRFGVGTTLPAGRVDFSGTSGGTFFDESNVTYNRWKSYGTTTATGKPLLFSAQNSGTTPDIYIHSSGRVLFSTTTDNGVDVGQFNGSAIATAWKTTGGATTDYVTGTGSLINFNSGVRTATLTGFVSGAGTVSATDNVLQAINKLDGNDALKAPLASPALTGTPTAPTATAGTNTTQLATTAFVTNAVSTSNANSVLLTGNQTKTGILTMDNPAGGGTKIVGTNNQASTDALIELTTSANSNRAINIEHNGNGVGLRVNASSTSNNQAIAVNVTSSGVASPFLSSKNNVTVFRVSDLGAVIAESFRVNSLNTAPASATATGTLGEIRITSTHIYVCIATNTWVRSALATW